jgi:hypothetical protein
MRQPVGSKPDSSDEFATGADDLYQSMYALLTDESSDAHFKVGILVSVIQRIERRVQIALNERTLHSESSPSNGKRMIHARERFNGAWMAAFPRGKTKPLSADETVVSGLFQEVADDVTLFHALGYLELASSDGGLNQDALDIVTARKATEPGKTERPLKHLQRLLHEVVGLSQEQARQLMNPLFKIRDLRNAHPPYHVCGEAGRLAFASIGHSLPIKDPVKCWNDITAMYVEGLNQISATLESALRTT